MASWVTVTMAMPIKTLTMPIVCVRFLPCVEFISTVKIWPLKITFSMFITFREFFSCMNPLANKKKCTLAKISFSHLFYHMVSDIPWRGFYKFPACTGDDGLGLHKGAEGAKH